MDGKPFTEGLNLLSENELTVSGGGAVLLLRDGTDLRLGQNTKAKFQAQLDSLSATLNAGTVEFRSASQSFSLLTGNVVIRPESRASHATVTVEPRQLIIAAAEAPVRVAVARHEWIVSPGQALRLADCRR